jgi:hypothetical protein
VSENKKDYSDYISYASNFLLALSLFSGFTFASITILITQLPDPSQILIQVTLFFLATMFYVFVFLSFYFIGCILHCVKNVPPDTELLGYKKVVSFLATISFPIWGVSVVLMFLFWNLLYLALASFIVLLAVDIWSIFAIVKPNFEHLKKMRSQK